jgi:hypothetical protein
VTRNKLDTREPKARNVMGKRRAKPKSQERSVEHGGRPKYPRHPVADALRIPKAILEQNAGRACSDADAAKYLGLKTARGPFAVEISSALKFGFLVRPEQRKVEVTELAKKALRPQKPDDVTDALREGILKAPDISEVYAHYRGENLPDDRFLENTLIDTFGIPIGKAAEFKDVFLASLRSAQLLDEHDGKFRVLDPTKDGRSLAAAGVETAKRTVRIDASDTCFVMMPFAAPIGNYYSLIYEPAIRKAGLTPVRADTEIFGSGKIMNQIWAGIRAARVLVAELTTKNPNVFYELGIAHALKKPVVLVSSNEPDVPFDLHHIRVIYYDHADPFWGQKLLDKVAENIVSAIENPEEAVFEGTLPSE